MKLPKRALWIGAVLAWLGGWGLGYVWGPEGMAELLAQPEHQVHRLYPRLAVEGPRLGADFLWEKLGHLWFRVGVLGLLLGTARHWYPLLMQRMSEWAPRLGQPQQFYFFLNALYAWDLYEELNRLIAEFYQPSGWLALIPHTWPQGLWVGILPGCQALFSLGAVLFPKREPLAWAAWAMLVLNYSLSLGFEKVDHTYATWLYAGLGLILGLRYRWGGGLALALVVQSYFLAAAEKLLASGLYWVQGSSLIAFLKLHPTPLGEWLQGYPLVCGLLALGAWGLQVCAPWAFFRPKTLPWVAGSLILFHLGTWLLLDAGGPTSPWIATWLVLGFGYYQASYRKGKD